MCRHLARLGPPELLSALLYDPPHSLLRQASEPRMQRCGRLNADGFGVGWYVAGRAEPVRFRRAQPMWSDVSFADVATAVRAGCVLAAVRSATVGFPVEESCAAPFRHGRWLFSLNGAVADYPSVRSALGARVADTPDGRAPVDSALVFGLALAQWTSGAGLADGLARTVADVACVDGSNRLNLLASDGAALAATALGDTLFVRSDGPAVMLASEPHDDGPGWEAVPEGSLVHAEPGRVQVRPL